MAKALMLYYCFHEHVKKLEREVAPFSEDRFRQRQIIHSANGSSFVPTQGVASVKGTEATRICPGRRCRRLEVFCREGGVLAGALRHRDRLRRGTLGAGLAMFSVIFEVFPIRELGWLLDNAVMLAASWSRSRASSTTFATRA